MLGFIIIVIGILSFLMIKNILNGKTSITLIIITIAGGYKLYDYLKSEIGSKFLKIKLKKLQLKEIM